jgi:hypothetical protein
MATVIDPTSPTGYKYTGSNAQELAAILANQAAGTPGPLGGSMPAPQQQQAAPAAPLYGQYYQDAQNRYNTQPQSKALQGPHAFLTPEQMQQLTALGPINSADWMAKAAQIAPSMFQEGMSKHLYKSIGSGFMANSLTNPDGTPLLYAPRDFVANPNSGGGNTPEGLAKLRAREAARSAAMDPAQMGMGGVDRSGGSMAADQQLGSQRAVPATPAVPGVTPATPATPAQPFNVHDLNGPGGGVAQQLGNALSPSAVNAMQSVQKPHIPYAQQFAFRDVPMVNGGVRLSTTQPQNPWVQKAMAERDASTIARGYTPQPYRPTTAPQHPTVQTQPYQQSKPPAYSGIG